MRKFTRKVKGFCMPSRSIAFIRKKIIPLSFPLFLLHASGYAQTGVSNKIDPAFQFVMKQPVVNGRRIVSNVPAAFNLQPGRVSVAPGQPLEERYSCIIYTSDIAALASKGIYVNTILPKFVTAWATLDQIQQLAALESIQYIAAPEEQSLHNDIAVGATGASLLHQGRLNNTTYKGKGVIVAIFDTGIDWKHLDFRNPNDTTQSRILRIWDQTITPIAGESSPSSMGYGVEYTQAQISDELDGTPTGYVRESDIHGHGTHVAGTAAGNGNAIPATRKYTGMAPEADIVVVKGGNGSFSSTNEINAMTYLKNLAAALGKPIVLNMSLGGQSGPHDGTLSHELAVDDFTSVAGRIVCISAGNDNGTNIHNQFSLAGSASNTISFTVPASTTAGTAFRYRVYVDDASAVSATATAPSSGGSVTAAAGVTSNGTVLSSAFAIYLTNGIDAGNGDRYVDMYVVRNGSNTTSPAGTWTLAITNSTASTINLHGWLNSISTDISTTALVGGNSDYLVGSPGNANTAITVAASVGRPSWYTYALNGGYYGTTARMDDIATFSSHGPRRDGVLKPEITTIGQHVISALSSASTQTASDIVIPGRYLKNQGTSMSCPVVTGAVALLLQANPSASVSQVRSALFTNASADALTGTTPNNTWGYGRLDVYKAVAATFNCSPTLRATYQYDASNLQTADNGVGYTTTRVAVRFTPDITGKLGGAFYHTSTTRTALVMEVRTNNSGNPGTLLGTVNLPDTLVALYSWNYVDLSGLNIDVTSGTDYFVIVYRSALSSAGWSIRRENTSLDNRSLISTDGVSWSNPGYDYKIRSVVYSNPQLTGSLAAANTSNSRDVNTSNLFIDNSCQLIAQLTPAGASPVSGSVDANVWIESSVPTYSGTPFVQRHYQLTPATSASTATGNVTLYFTQAEFDAFNAHAASTLDLPTGPADATGISNLRVAKFAGSTNDGTGLPASYTNGMLLLDPADTAIVWNSTASRWEVTVSVSGFSGFIVQTSLTSLPLLVESFTGYPSGVTNVLNWRVSCDNTTPTFYIQRSANGTDYSTIGTTTAVNGCGQLFTYTDKQPLPGKDYYRIKIVEDNNAVHYTKYILLQTGSALQTSLYPTVVSAAQPVQVVLAEADGVLRITDATGRQVLSKSLTTGVQNVGLPVSASGVYFYSIQNSKGSLASGKLIVQ